MAKLLIVDDEDQIRELIKKYALYENHQVIEAKDGLEAINVVKQKDPDLVIMDIMMPNMDGFSSVREIRKFSLIPIIMLSARSEEYDKIYGFDQGIDDYVTKPFSPKELMLRINAVLNRYRPKTLSNDINNEWNYQGIKIDLKARVVYIEGVRIETTPKEYDLLLFFTNNPNVALTREQVMEKIWGKVLDGDDRTLDTHVKSLRKKLGKYADNIITIRKVGYRFETK